MIDIPKIIMRYKGAGKDIFKDHNKGDDHCPEYYMIGPPVVLYEF